MVIFLIMGYSSLDHAKHNESTCNYLAKANKHDDWVITTAFYSAMHYLRHKLFPLTIQQGRKKTTLASFEDYCTHQNLHGKKHKVMRTLVEENCDSSIAATYNQMLDISWTARYSKYRFSKKISSLAQKRLVAIRNYCK